MQTLSLHFVLKQLHDLGFSPGSHYEAVRIFDAIAKTKGLRAKPLYFKRGKKYQRIALRRRSRIVEAVEIYTYF